MARLQVYRRADRKWAWCLLATNGQIIATDGGQGYEHKAECREMARSIVEGLYSVASKHVEELEEHEHRPVQHRDGKPPWCSDCGLTADYQRPISRLHQG